MVALKYYIIPSIWNMLFIFCATLTIVILKNIKLKKENSKKECFAIGGLLFVLIIVLESLAYFYIKKARLITGIIEITYELICWIIIIDQMKDILKKAEKCNGKISKEYIYIIIVSIIVSIIYIAICGINNSTYFYPTNEYGYIENYYFNADVNRGIEYITTTQSQHKIHPLYRFIILPILLPVIMLNLVAKLFEYSTIISNGYVVLVLQSIFNTVTASLIYSILKENKIREKACIITTTLFIASFPFMWLTILPETYSITLCMLMSFLYLYQKRKIECIPFGIFAIGANLMSTVLVGIVLGFEIIKNRKKILSYMNKFQIIIVIILIAIGAILAFSYTKGYIKTWSENSTQTIIRAKGGLNLFFMPMLLGPSFKNIGTYFVQVDFASIQSIIIWTACVIIAAIGYFSKKRDFLANGCVLFLIIGFILHVLLGYGYYNSIIYCALYSWTIILMIGFGISYLLEKIKFNKIIEWLVIIIIAVIFIFNIIWLISLTNNISKKTFTTSFETGKTYYYLKNGEETEGFIIKYNCIVRLVDGKIILKGIDSCSFNEEENTITGLLANTNWFKIYFENGDLKLVITDQNVEVEENKFYILGMGLRKKFLVIKENDKKYSIIKYPANEVIEKNLTLENIDYEKYTVNFKNSENNEIILYENENGIFINKNHEIIELDSSTKVNIPNFDGYKHEKILKQLFHEVMINITEDGPKPNFIVYDKVWYRDAATIAMVLEKTNNVKQIEQWINSITEIYDMQNGEKEADNLGQVLYLVSLVENKNEQLINRIKQEAKNLKNEEGYIEGKTDGTTHAQYQTRWLIFGLKRNGLDYSEYKIPEINDFYGCLMWFDGENIKNTSKLSDRWPYLYYAYLHYNKIKIDNVNNIFPISSEFLGSKANYENLKNNLKIDSKLVSPHAWSAAEMFLYFLDWDEGNI